MADVQAVPSTEEAQTIVLDENQEAAINFLANNINSDENRVIGLFGGGGTGKSTILRALTQHDDVNPADLMFSATTNKAVSRLAEDIETVVTVHKAICTPVFTEAYKNICDFFNEKQTKEIKKRIEADSSYKHSLNFEFSIKAKELINQLVGYKIDDAKDELEYFAKNKINTFDSRLFKRYKLNEPEEKSTVLIIDEASMLPATSNYDKFSNLKTIGLDVVLQVFNKVILVGDSMQLPPVQGKDSSLDNIPHHELTKNYRSDKGLQDLITYARNGKHLSMYKSKAGENVRVISEVPDSYYEETKKREHQIVHICYKNATRKSIVKRIRGNDGKPLDGEPVIYRGAQKDTVNKGDIGFYIKKDNVMYFNEDYAQFFTQRMYMDEYTDSYGMFQFAYAMTAHMSQGSEFDHVVVYLNDIPPFISGEIYHKWVYTAVSRARKSVTIVV